MADIYKISEQTVDLVCYSNNGTEKSSPTRLEPDEYCEVKCPEGQKPYPIPNERTTCQVNSKWTNPLNCLAVCDPVVVFNGSLKINSISETKPLLDRETPCIKDGQKVDKEPLFAGTTCTFSQGFCGLDQEGYAYYQKAPDVTCLSSGSWQSVDSAVTDPICTSQPCDLVKAANITSAELIECQFNEANPSLNGKETAGEHHNEGVECTLKDCATNYKPLQPSKSVCRRGVWEGKVSGEWKPMSLSCTPTNTPCDVSSLVIAHGSTDCTEATKVTGNESQVLGGETCELSCDTGFLKQGHAQCIGPHWSEFAACGKLISRLILFL